MSKQGQFYFKLIMWIILAWAIINLLPSLMLFDLILLIIYKSMRKEKHE